jgi:predicted RNA-binding Zn-ribbon protein involved in translation (DUF1610 family)
MSSREVAGYSCPECGQSKLPRDNTPGAIFRCPECGKQIHEAVADAADDLEPLADRDDAIGAKVRALLNTGGVVE